jgi:malate dehydrogenase
MQEWRVNREWHVTVRIPTLIYSLVSRNAHWRTELFDTNASVIQNLTSAIAEFCPKAYVLVITNPVNSTLPIAVETLKKHGVFNAAKVFGVTTLDVVRASTFVAHVKNIKDPKSIKIPVIGGHNGATILPLFSQSQPPVSLTDEERDSITYRKSTHF